MVTGHYLPEKDAVIFFLILGYSIVAGLSLAIWRRYFPETNVGMVIAAVLAQGVALGLTIWCTVYETAIACGFAFTMVALASIWCASMNQNIAVFGGWHWGAWLMGWQ